MSFEALFIQVQLKVGTCVLESFYRPPGVNIVDFNSDVNILLYNVTKQRKHEIIMGDFNADLLKSDNNHATKVFIICIFLCSTAWRHYLPSNQANSPSDFPPGDFPPGDFPR